MDSGSHHPPRSLSVSGCIFAGILLVRLIVLTRLSSSALLLPNSGDMQFYNEWARRILGGHFTDYHAFYGLPLYPYLLAGLYKLFGYSPFIPGFLQALLEAGTGVLLYKLAVAIFAVRSEQSQTPALFWKYRGECVGFLAALAWGFFLPEQAYAAILMPTAGVVFIFWFIVVQIVRRREMPGSIAWFLFGLLIGFTAMGVATILFLVPLLIAALLLRWNNSSWTKFGAVGLLFGGIALGTSPCWIHNYFVAKDPVFLSAHSGVNFWIGNNPLATGYPRFPPGLHAGQKAMLQDSITTAERAIGGPLKRSQVSAYWSKKTTAYIKNNFGSWLQLILTKIKNFWSAFQYDDLSIITLLREQNILLPGLKFGLVAALGLPGLLIAAWKFPLSRWVSAAVLLQMASLLTVFVTERYRVAAVPGLLLGASFGLIDLWANLLNAKYVRVAIYGVLFVVATIFVSSPQKDPGLWALDAYNSGWQALQANDLPLAEKKLQVAYSYAPENSEINFALGNLRLAQGSRDEAKSFYAVALRLDPHNEGVLNNLGVLALEEGRWALAEKFVRKALEQDPDDAKTHYLLAKALWRKGDAPQAKSEIAKAIELDPNPREFSQLRDEIHQTGRP